MNDFLVIFYLLDGQKTIRLCAYESEESLGLGHKHSLVVKEG